jgi:aldose 1-epimerase
MMLCGLTVMSFRRSTAASGSPFDTPADEKMISQRVLGSTPEGEVVDLFSLTNVNGVKISAMSYGCIVTQLYVPDRTGSFADIVLGFDTLDAYLAGHPYLGAVVGRYCNRIAGGRFQLDGVDYRLATNNGTNHLHGGIRGFDKVVWSAEPYESSRGDGVAFTYTSDDGEEGYPGTLTIRVSYTLTDADELICEYHATTDRATHVNLSQHSYFNLRGKAEGDILGHEMMINADRFTPVDANLIPTGELRHVAGTPLDFRKPTPIGARIDLDDEQLRLARGYDHNYVLNRSEDSLVLAARVHEPVSGRVMEVHTTEPGVQLYTGNYLDGSLTGKGGCTYARRQGFCLETQHFPDSPNQPQFPSTVLQPGEVYSSRTVFRFAISAR